MAWAYVENGVVVDRVRVEPSVIFNEGYALLFIEAPDDVDYGWIYDGTKFIEPSQPSQEAVNKQKAIEIRADRDTRLAQTDWTQAADVPQATKDKWVAYRQALRDIPQQPGFPENITWPVAPDA